MSYLAILAVFLIIFIIVYAIKSLFFKSKDEPHIDQPNKNQTKNNLGIFLFLIVYILVTWIPILPDPFSLLKGLEVLFIIPLFLVFGFLLVKSSRSYNQVALVCGLVFPVLTFIFNSFIIFNLIRNFATAVLVSIIIYEIVFLITLGIVLFGKRKTSALE